MGVRRDRLKDRERGMEKQLQQPSAAQPAGISFFFIFFINISFFFSSSVCVLTEDCWLCLADCCMLHVPVELSHTLRASPRCSAVCIRWTLADRFSLPPSHKPPSVIHIYMNTLLSSCFYAYYFLSCGPNRSASSISAEGGKKTTAVNIFFLLQAS